MISRILSYKIFINLANFLSYWQRNQKYESTYNLSHVSPDPLATSLVIFKGIGPLTGVLFQIGARALLITYSKPHMGDIAV